jgi:hypothetical protein
MAIREGAQATLESAAAKNVVATMAIAAKREAFTHDCGLGDGVIDQSFRCRLRDSARGA